MEPGTRLRRALWSAVIFLAVIGVAVALRRIVHLWPILTRGYIPVATTSNPRAAQLVALDDIFARRAILTFVHIVPGLLFMLLGPLQFSSTIRARHLRWHRWSGREAGPIGVRSPAIRRDGSTAPSYWGAPCPW